MAGWEERVRALVSRVYEESVKSLTREDLLEEENLFVRALAGRWGNACSRLERSLVTLLGHRAPEFFKPFFSQTSPAPEPFDFAGLLRGREYVVKVVTGPNAFNSTTRRSVEEASYSVKGGRPVILTLQGGYFEPQQVGAAVWYSAPASWRLVTGEEGAYRRFRSIVFEEAARWREEAYRMLREAAQSGRGGRRSAGAG